MARGNSWTVATSSLQLLQVSGVMSKHWQCSWAVAQGGGDSNGTLEGTKSCTMGSCGQGSALGAAAKVGHSSSVCMAMCPQKVTGKCRRALGCFPCHRCQPRPVSPLMTALCPKQCCWSAAWGNDKAAAPAGTGSGPGLSQSSPSPCAEPAPRCWESPKFLQAPSKAGLEWPQGWEVLGQWKPWVGLTGPLPVRVW